MDVIDKLLETADMRLDQVAGKGNKFTKSVQLSLAVDKDRLMNANVVDMPKPQNAFLGDTNIPDLHTRSTHSIKPHDQ